MRMVRSVAILFLALSSYGCSSPQDISTTKRAGYAESVESINIYYISNPSFYKKLKNRHTGSPIADPNELDRLYETDLTAFGKKVETGLQALADTSEINGFVTILKQETLKAVPPPEGKTLVIKPKNLKVVCTPCSTVATFNVVLFDANLQNNVWRTDSEIALQKSDSLAVLWSHIVAGLRKDGLIKKS